MSRSRRVPVGTGLRPGLVALRRRDVPALRADLLAGATVAAYLVPQVLAYAEVAGLPAVAGLWAAVAALGAYALLGSSRRLSVGPESTTAIMTALAIAPLAAGDPARHAALAAALALLVGAICLAGRLARLGFLADLLSRPVLVGYLTGIALIMIAGQLGRITGIAVEGGTFLQDVGATLRGLDRVHLPTLVVGLTVLALLLLGARLAPKVPAPLLVVLLAALASARCPAGCRSRPCPRSGSPTSPRCCYRRSGSPWSPTPTTSSPAAPSPRGTASASTPTGSCSRWARRTSPPGWCRGSRSAAAAAAPPSARPRAAAASSPRSSPSPPSSWCCWWPVPCSPRSPARRWARWSCSRRCA